MSNFIIQLKKFLIILLTLLVCIALLSACQPTPENGAIVNKGNGSLDKLITEKADASQEWTETEDRIVWEDSKNVDTEIGACIVTVCMDAEMPSYPDRVPVYLIEPKGFSMDYLKKAATYLLKGEMFDGIASKEDIMAEILDFKEKVSKKTILEENQSAYKYWLEELEKQYNNAPESNHKPKFEFTIDDYGLNALSVKSYPNDNSIMNFSALTDEAGKCDNFFFRVNEFNTMFYYLNEKLGKNIQTGGTKMTYDEALTIANNAMTTLFNEPFAMVDVRITDQINVCEYLWNDGVETSLKQAYVFCYSRGYDGFPALYIDPALIFLTESTEYAKPYVREYAQLVVDDRGLVYMSYEGYSDTIKKLNDNVKLMPFEDVLEQFKNSVFQHFLWGRKAQITITKIEFGMVREPVRNNQNQYMMVPAWNFIGNINSNGMEQQEKSILALNAIDGSVVTEYESVTDPK